MDRPWQGNWRTRILERLHQYGYHSILIFAKDRPTATIPQLAEEIGNDVAPIQIEELMHQEAIANNKLTEFSRDYLVRCILEFMPMGWRIGEDFDYLDARTFARWGAAFDGIYEPQLEQIWSNLCAIPPPTGWIPRGADDPLLDKAFQGIHLSLRQ